MTITGGEREHSHSGASGMEWNVPKQDLIAGVQVLLERGELKIARSLKESGTLVRELMDVRAVAGRSGRMKMGANGYGQHDDLVIALALACWKSHEEEERVRESAIDWNVRRLHECYGAFDTSEWTS